ncbi:hypothetical protein VTH82DRAFT_123 [Thermothelomyces myriococcoides]
MRIIYQALSLAILALPGTSAGPNITPNCSDVTFNLSIVSQNVIFASPPDPDNTTEIVEFTRTVWRGEVPATNGTQTISDTFAIVGTFCLPPDHSQPPKGLQILLHGITYNKTMWAGGGFPEYDWHAFATARGYATLALDRLGHGASPQRPDPLTVVQPQIQIDLVHAIIAAVRDPSSSSSSSSVPGADIGQPFSTVILVGHSFGSFLSAGLATQYPEDADALVLTGYSGQPDFSRMAVASWVSAGEWQPERFGPDLARGYLTLSEAAEREAAFYFADGSDPAVAAADFAGEDTVTAGELGALPGIAGPAVGYAGDVLVVTGVEDVIFCVPPLESCEAILRDTATGFPDARSFDYYAPTNTGHDLTLHYSAAETADKVHDWLDSKISRVKAQSQADI